MFTVGAFAWTILIAWFVDKKNEQDRALYSDPVSPVLLHIRQDLKMVVFMLAAVVVMLGVVADRIR